MTKILLTIAVTIGIKTGTMDGTIEGTQCMPVTVWRTWLTFLSCKFLTIGAKRYSKGVKRYSKFHHFTHIWAGNTDLFLLKQSKNRWKCSN